EAGVMPSGEIAHFGAVQREGGDVFGVRDEAARPQIVPDGMDPENRKGIRVPTSQHCLDIGNRRAPRRDLATGPHVSSSLPASPTLGYRSTKWFQTVASLFKEGPPT